MLYQQTQIILEKNGIKDYQLLSSIDGPGIGNSAAISRIDYPEKGGQYAFLLGYKFPFKGLVSTVHIDLLKRLIVMFLRRMDIWETRIGAGLLFILPRFITKRVINSFINYFSEIEEFTFRGGTLPDIRYCDCVRELRRVFDLMGKEKIVWVVKEFITMLIENDSAYRFRFQDIMTEVRKEELIAGGKRQRKEIERLLDILYQREVGVETAMKYKWKTGKKYVSLALRFSKESRDFISKFFKEIDINKLIPDQADDYFNAFRYDYLFRGKPLIDRIMERKLIEGDNWIWFEEVAKGMVEYAKTH